MTPIEHSVRPLWIDDATLAEMARIVNRPAWVEAVPQMASTAMQVRRAIMREKFRRAVLRMEMRAA